MQGTLDGAEPNGKMGLERGSEGSAGRCGVTGLRGGSLGSESWG